jgi:hypothetical protein
MNIIIPAPEPFPIPNIIASALSLETLSLPQVLFHRIIHESHDQSFDISYLFTLLCAYEVKSGSVPMSPRCWKISETSVASAYHADRSFWLPNGLTYYYPHLTTISSFSLCAEHFSLSIYDLTDSLF